ncbi:hypothetical protein K525DRAFT_200320 [Schizophyllum commune Loenen D]|nr:hypothetical protein K525DRAFT_200320 [Schizophyllum commune Loenen D]
MTAFEEKGVQTLLPQEHPQISKHRARKSTKNKGKRLGRPKFHKRLHPAHADIPFVPEAHDTNTTRYWHLGWPVSDTFVDDILKKYIPRTLAEERPAPEAKYASFMHIASRICHCNTLRLVLVQPDDSAPWQSPLAEDGERGVTFCMIVSDCSKYYFTKRPTKEQMGPVREEKPCALLTHGGSPEETADRPIAKKARRPRPKYHRRLHPSHADIPFVPEERGRSSSRYWHFGWPVSDTFVNNTIDFYAPRYLDKDRPSYVRYGRFLTIAEKMSKTTIRLVLVEPDASTLVPEYQSAFAEDGAKAVTFCMVVSDARMSLFTQRPTKEQMTKLVTFFGGEPQWRMDAKDKSLFYRYGHDD